MIIRNRPQLFIFHSIYPFSFFARCLAIVFALLLASGCVTTPTVKEQKPVFYPSLPNAPRIQFLTRFSDANDIAGPRSSFTEFVLGKTTPESEAVRKPYGVAIHDGRVLVVDTRAPGYAIFDLRKQRFNVITGGEGAGGRLRKPINIAIDQDGSKFITDTDRDQILVYDREDRYVRAYGKEGQFKPADVAIWGEQIFVADVKHHRIHVLDKRTGRTLLQFGKPGSLEGEFYHPTNLALSRDGYLYVTNTTNFRIQKFTLDGQLVRSFGTLGTGLGHFARPKGLALDRENHMYVVDAAFENVQVFDPEGKLLMFFGEPGDRPENINLPAAVTIDYDNVELFQKYADPNFKLEYLIFVTSQFGVNKVSVFGFGKMQGMNYSVTERR